MTLSYTDLAVTTDEADAYAEARDWQDWYGDEAALRRGQDFIASRYNGRWITSWDNGDAPDVVKYAIIEAARRELVTPGSLAPDLKRGGRIKSVGAGSARVEYMDSAPGGVSFPAIDALLKGVVTTSGAGVDLLRV